MLNWDNYGILKEIIMWQILSEKDKKKYALLNALYRKYDPITIQSLSEVSHLSQRSVLNYLDELKVDLFPLSGEIFSSNEGMKLLLPDSIGMDYFQRKLLRESIGFQLLEYLFFQGEASCSELQEHFFLSSSSLERILKKIRKSLEPYHLKVSGSPLAVRGQEFFIRRFYTRYFFEAYSQDEWPFRNLDKENVHRLLKTHPPYCHEYSKFIKSQEILFQFAVSLTRAQKGHFHPVYPVSFFTEKKLPEIRQELRQSLTGFPLGALSLDTVLDELSFMKLQYTTEYYKERLQKDPAFQESTRELFRLIEETTDLFQLPPSKCWPFLIELYKLLQLHVKGKGLTVLPDYLFFRSRDFIIVTHHQLEYPFFYTYVTSYFKDILKSRGVNASEALLEELYYTLLCHSESLTNHLFKNFKSCKVLLYSHLSQNHAQAVRDVLIANFNSMIDVEIYTEAELTAKDLEKYQFDLLVSTTSVEIDIKNAVLYLHFHEKGYQISSIYKAISTVVDKKKADQMKRIKNHMDKKETLKEHPLTEATFTTHY